MPTVGGAGVADELGWRCDGGEIESREEKGIRVESRGLELNLEKRRFSGAGRDFPY
jgi:hypothetical protein